MQLDDFIENTIEEEHPSELSDLEMNDFFEEVSLNDLYEDILDTIVQKASDINKGMYSLEDLFKVETGLNNFIPKDISQEDIYLTIYEKVDIIKFERSLKALDKILPDLNDETFSLKEIYTSLEETSSTSKYTAIINKVHNKIKSIASKVTAVDGWSWCSRCCFSN